MEAGGTKRNSQGEGGSNLYEDLQNPPRPQEKYRDVS